jgi:ribosome biogenesis GTPase
LIIEKNGKVIKGLGGLYTVLVPTESGAEYYSCYAKGNLKRDEEKVLVGDEVVISIDDAMPDGVIISEVLRRKNSLIRPPISNLDYLFILFAAKKPAPVLETIDKLIAIAIHNRITPVCVITKADLSECSARELYEAYRTAGIEVFVTSSESSLGVDMLKEYVEKTLVDGRSAAFAGASGVGKSTLMNALFPSLSLTTAEISRKIERGKHTTRHVELFEINDGESFGLIADTPGFSLIDFERFDFFDLDSLLPTFPDIERFSCGCKYSDCTHVGEGEEDCAVARAVNEGKVMKSRHDSYKSVWKILKEKKPY